MDPILTKDNLEWAYNVALSRLDTLGERHPKMDLPKPCALSDLLDVWDAPWDSPDAPDLAVLLARLRLSNLTLDFGGEERPRCREDLICCLSNVLLTYWVFGPSAYLGKYDDRVYWLQRPQGFTAGTFKDVLGTPITYYLRPLETRPNGDVLGQAVTCRQGDDHWSFSTLLVTSEGVRFSPVQYPPLSR